MKKNGKALYITQAAMIAALYVVLTYAISTFNLASGAVQVRISEALTILPYFTNAAVPGLFVGCVISNCIAGANGTAIIWDIIFGSLATLLGAMGSYAVRKNKWLVPLPPIIANTIIVPLVLLYGYGFTGTLPYFMLTVGAGEVISCGVLGMILLNILNKYKNVIFTQNMANS